MMVLRTIWISAAAMALMLSACGGAAKTDASQDDPAAEASTSAPAGDFCTSVTDALSHLDILENDDIDMAKLGDLVKAAHSAFSAVEPPPEVAADWQNIQQTFKLFADAYD